ncbi:polysaccharide deacetylase family protein [Pseudogulbenkiania ferrooxidans]|uniref:Polysaccharide deacetylase n=1 Tax=Pseudogulbenkiania ferrooxidans 2002 TaxID=279714 RepID=B9YYP1_9NEIS|nr:polysaccharide deacetylase family protein [Pseudogulbenkiania ferrooxidans]EEG10244.1 polysaccharide deacetylase [Pseudogulbenkiania ferrooxidans 2002]
MKPARAVPVLMYHHVSPSKGLVTVSPATFEAQMRWLAEHGWTTLSTDDFAGFLAGRPVPDKSVLVTFDDGYLDNWVYAHPVLERFGQRATLFTITGWIGDGAVRPHAASGQTLPDTPDHKACKRAVDEGRADTVMMRWSEIEAARAAGTFDFHSHTHSHARWDKLCASASEKRDRLAEDLAASRRTLVERLGGVSDHLCWPQGYFDDDYLDVARAAGFRHLYTTIKDVNTPATPAGHIHRLVTKDKPGEWLGSRVRWFARPWLGHLYAKVSG